MSGVRADMTYQGPKECFTLNDYCHTYFKTMIISASNNLLDEHSKAAFLPSQDLFIQYSFTIVDIQVSDWVRPDSIVLDYVDPEMAIRLCLTGELSDYFEARNHVMLPQ